MTRTRLHNIDNPGPPTDTSRLDGLFKLLWKEHGIFCMHIQDDRPDEHTRAIIKMYGNQQYGRRF